MQWESTSLSSSFKKKIVSCTLRKYKYISFLIRRSIDLMRSSVSLCGISSYATSTWYRSYCKLCGRRGKLHSSMPLISQTFSTGDRLGDLMASAFSRRFRVTLAMCNRALCYWKTEFCKAWRYRRRWASTTLSVMYCNAFMVPVRKTGDDLLSYPIAFLTITSIVRSTCLSVKNRGGRCFPRCRLTPIQP